MLQLPGTKESAITGTMLAARIPIRSWPRCWEWMCKRSGNTCGHWTSWAGSIVEGEGTITDVIRYTAEDFKKYAYAEAKNYIRRIEEIVEALDKEFGFDGEDSQDLGFLFENAVGKYLHQAAFFDDHHQVEAFEKWEGEVRSAHSRAEGPLPEFEEMFQAENTFSDGRMVTTTVRYGEGDDETVTHVWHPDPLHPGDQPGAVLCFSQGPHPFRWRYATVVAPGVLSEVRREEDTGEEAEG